MIREVTDALVDVISRATPDLGTWVVISSLSSADTAPASTRLAVSLYAVEEHPHLRNRPLVPGAAGLVRAPLSLRLSYLMTYVGAHDEAQIRLARVIQAFHTTPIISGPELPVALADQVRSITVRLRTTTADERNQVWGALGTSARLALFYEVDVAPIEVLERTGVGEILTHRVEYVGAP